MNAITEEILEMLYDLAARPYRIVYGYFPKEYSRNSIQVALKRLEKKGFIGKEILDNEVCVQLSELGLRELETRRQRRKEQLPVKDKSDEKWDGFWRVVIFDIPEKRRVARDILRNQLKNWGFSPWQQSVWVTKKNCTQALRNFINSIGIKDWVRVIESNNVE